MTFTPNIPQAGQSLGQTVTQIRNNFTNYNTLFSVDHVGPVSLATPAGQHLQVSLNNYLASLSPAPAYPAIGAFAPNATNSFTYAFNASAAGSQLVYQPSIATVQVPLSPRSLARITNTGANTYALGNGPYGTGTNFNALAPTFIGPGTITYNFASPLAGPVGPPADYFVIFSSEGLNATSVTNKTNAGFQFNVGSSIGNSVVVMVF